MEISRKRVEIEFVPAEVDGFDREIDLTRRSENLMDFLRERAREPGTVSLEEARKLLTR